jgi:cytoskeletal protein RodZ
MKEIGEALREQRESIGITIEEAAADLKLKPSQIENIEAGNKDAFDDIFYLKYFVRDYSKYLGLNYEDMIDEFNEFLFDYTSKISIDDIKKARKHAEINKAKEEKRIASPYTVERKRKFHVSKIFVIGLVLLLGVGLIYFGITKMNEIKNNNTTTENIIK